MSIATRCKCSGVDSTVEKTHFLYSVQTVVIMFLHVFGNAKMFIINFPFGPPESHRENVHN